MEIAIVGHTGFVGSTLARATGSRWLYNSRNIADMRGRRFELVINAGVSSLKWLANQQPAEDRRRIEQLWDVLRTVEADRLVHISTMDVMPSGTRWDEATPAAPDEALQPYGRHRRELERWVEARFPHHLIVRLPHLFGRGLKKNFVFDLLHGAATMQLVDARDVYSLYDLANLWRDLEVFLQHGWRVVNVSVEPMTAAEVAQRGFDVSFANECARAPVRYDMRTRWPYRHAREDGHMYTREETVAALRRFRAEGS